MRAERLSWAIVVAGLLLVGLLIGRWLAPLAEAEPLAELPSAADFRTWLWERRALDLLAQVGLIFAGALGVAAILPRSDEPSGGEAEDGLD